MTEQQPMGTDWETVRATLDVDAERVAAAQAEIAAELPPEPTVCVGDFPQLRLITWWLRPETVLAESDALEHYERNWRFVAVAALTDAERTFIRRLVATYRPDGLLHTQIAGTVPSPRRPIPPP